MQAEYDTEDEMKAYDHIDDLEPGSMSEDDEDEDEDEDSEPDVDFEETVQARGAVGTPFVCKKCGETLIGLAKFRAHMLVRTIMCLACGAHYFNIRCESHVSRVATRVRAVSPSRAIARPLLAAIFLFDLQRDQDTCLV